MKNIKKTMIINDRPIEVTKKNMKNIRMYVRRLDNSICLSVPRFMSDKEVRVFLSKNSDWIEDAKTKLAGMSLSPQAFQSGEDHQFFGEKCTLIVKMGGVRNHRFIAPDRIEIQSLRNDDVENRKKLLDEFYRHALKQEIPAIIKNWEEVLGIKVEEWRIRKMKTRWGSCNSREGRIWLNLELAKWPKICLEYVVVHEMLHLIEKHHNERFYQLLDTFHPKWKEAEQLLKTF